MAVHCHMTGKLFLSEKNSDYQKKDFFHLEFYHLGKKIARPHVFVFILTQKVLPKVSKLNLHFKQAFEVRVTASVGLSIG